MVISCTTMLPRFTLSTMVPHMGYRNTLPPNKYAAEVLASNSGRANRRSKIFLKHEPKGLNYDEAQKVPCLRGKMNERVPYHTTQDVQCNVPKSETVNRLFRPRKGTLHVRPNDIAQFENLSDSKPSLVRDPLDDLSLRHTNYRSPLRFRAKLCILKLDASLSD